MSFAKMLKVTKTNENSEECTQRVYVIEAPELHKWGDICIGSCVIPLKDELKRLYDIYDLHKNDNEVSILDRAFASLVRDYGKTLVINPLERVRRDNLLEREQYYVGQLKCRNTLYV